jgi:hypothetical protein
MTSFTPGTCQRQVQVSVNPNLRDSLPRETVLLLQVLDLGQREEAHGLLKPVHVVLERLRTKSSEPKNALHAEGLPRIT